MARALQKTLNEFDIIHLHSWRHFQDMIVPHYAKKYGIPYILQVHNALSREEKTSRKLLWDTLIGRKVLRDASKAIALTKAEAEQYREMGVPENKIAIIPNGIDLSQYKKLPPKAPFKAKYNIPEDKKIILYLGRVHKTKGIDFLIKAYAYLTKKMKGNDAVLVIAGPDDGYLTDAKRLINFLKIADKVVFTGVLPENEKISAYVNSSIVVNVEPRNVFGLVPLEAAACSTPVIVSKGNAISETVHEGGFGFSVKYGDINELSGIMGEILGNDDLLREMGQRGRKFVLENCDWANIITKFEKVYEKLTK
jgi:glycosyltransferase involved in cell wall biosynthesis